jgi:hypothetical protein
MAEEEQPQEREPVPSLNFQGDQDDWDALPEQFKDHVTKAFMHKAGVGPDPGKYQGPPGILRRHGPDRLGRISPTEGDLAGERLLETGPAPEVQPGKPLPPQEAIQTPPIAGKKGKAAAPPHGSTPAQIGSSAVAPEPPAGEF